MALLDIKTLTWVEEIVEAAGRDRKKLPDFVESAGVIGSGKVDADSESGLECGTPVAKGAGVVREGESYFYLGTSTWMGLETNRPYIDSRQRTHTFCHFVRGLYVGISCNHEGR